MCGIIDNEEKMTLDESWCEAGSSAHLVPFFRIASNPRLGIVRCWHVGHLEADLEDVTLNMFGENGSHQGERGHFVDANRKHLTNLSTVALKDDDTIALRSSRELQYVLARIVFGT